MKLVRLHPNPDRQRPGPILPVGPFPFLVLRETVVVAAVRSTELLKEVLLSEGYDQFGYGSFYALSLSMAGAGYYFLDGKVANWSDDLHTVTTPAEIREEVTTLLHEELQQTAGASRPSFLQLLAAFWAAEDDLETQRIRDEIARAFGRRLEGRANVHDLVNEVVFPAEMPSDQRLAWLKAELDQLVIDGKLRKAKVADDQREYGEYDVLYELV